jgi:hypothetical protein
MPKRIIDGEGVWRSDKLAQVEPPSFRSEYTNLLPLALANGSFEVNARRIWSTVYSYNRPDVTLSQVKQILSEFERVKLLFRWIDDATGKEWGYWVGIEKPGRLPTPSRLKDRHERTGLEPPAAKLAEFTGSPIGTHRQPDGQPIGSLGLGLGSGIGSGKGSGNPMGTHEEPGNATPNSSAEAVDPGGTAQACERQTQTPGFNSTEVAQAICAANGWSGRQMIWAFQEAIDFQSAQMPEASLELVGEWLVQAYFDRRASKGDFAGGPQKFFEQALYRPGPNRRGNGKVSASSDDLVTRTMAQLEAK